MRKPFIIFFALCFSTKVLAQEAIYVKCRMEYHSRDRLYQSPTSGFYGPRFYEKNSEDGYMGRGLLRIEHDEVSFWRNDEKSWGDYCEWVGNDCNIQISSSSIRITFTITDKYSLTINRITGIYSLKIKNYIGIGNDNKASYQDKEVEEETGSCNGVQNPEILTPPKF